MVKIEKGKFLRFIKGVWILFFVSSTLLFLFIWGISVNLFGLFGEMPSLKALENPKSELSSEVYSADGKLMGKYYSVNRQPVEYNEISPYIINALLATEDIRFEQHSGIDPKATLRVIGRLGKDGGGSTLTQQLAKNLFDTRKVNKGSLSNVPLLGMVVIKLKEWMTSVRLEKNYTKKEILMMYLNEAEFGNNAFGIQAAAKTFFSKDASELNILEAATLVGVLKAPTGYNPIKNPERSIQRRNTVLQQMQKYNFISESELETYKKQPIKVNYRPEEISLGIAPHFRGEALKWLVDWAVSRGYAKNKDEGENYIYTSGLKIYTTIDSRVQQHAETAVWEHMKYKQAIFNAVWGKEFWIDEFNRIIPGYIEKEIKKTSRYKALREQYGKDSVKIYAELNKPVKMTVFSYEGEKDVEMSPMDSVRYYKKFLHAGMMSMEPKTGQVKAWVGGVNFKHFQYDHVKQGKRQPGSTFKPIVYAAAIDADYTPCYTMVDQPVKFPGWEPKNSYAGFTGASLPLRRAMAMSVNSIAAGLTKELGVNTIRKYAKELGIETELPEVASICLGSAEVTLFELLGAYSVFANKGYHIKPMFITKIIDKNGKILEEFTPDLREVMSEEKAYMMLDMLMAGTEKDGTSMGLRSSAYGNLFSDGNQLGGKTGTTQLHADGWYVGVSADLVTGIWVGGDDRNIRFMDIGNGQGAVLAMPAFGYYMRSIYSDYRLPYKKKPFSKPQEYIELDCDKSFYSIERYDPNNPGKRRK